MTRVKDWYEQHADIVLVVSFAMFSLVITLLMARSGAVYDIDYPFHWLRVMNVCHGDFGIVGGRAAMVFYPWLTLIPIAGLNGIFHSPVFIFYLLAWLELFSTYIISYYAYRSYDENRRHALLFSTLYMGSFTMFSNIFVSGAVPSAICLAVLPLVFFGTLERRWLMAGIGLYVIAFTHIPSTVLSLAMIVIIVGVDFHKMKRTDWYKLGGMLSLLIIATSVYWIPMTRLLMKYRIWFPSSIGGWSSGIFVTLIINTGLSFGALTAVSSWKKLTKSDKWLSFFALLVFLLNITPIAKLIPFLKAFQFAQRFDFFLALFGSYLAAKYWNADEHVADGLIAFALCVVLGCGLILSQNLENVPTITKPNQEKTRQFKMNDHSFKIVGDKLSNGDYKVFRK